MKALFIKAFIVILLLISIRSPRLIAQTGDFDVLFYKLDLNTGDTSIYLNGSATIHLKLSSPETNTIFFGLVNGYHVDSVLINGSDVPFLHENDSLQIDLSGNTDLFLSAEVFYNGYAYTGGPESGVFNRESIYGSRYTFTLTEPFDARYVFPVKQELKDKADSVYVFISTDRDLKAGANGILENTVMLPGNRVRYEWKSRYPTDYYLISFAVGDYMDYSFYTRFPEGEDSLLIQNYIYNSNDYFLQNREAIDKTGDLILLFSHLFGKYPFFEEKYGHSTAPIGGGMEHQTMTTLTNFSFLLVAHELFHQWFGDHVTCADWQDIWINEGFASYGEYLAEEFLVSKEEAVKWMFEAHNYILAEDDGSVYVPEEFENDEDRIFDHRLSYKKGAAIIHMIRQEIGNDSVFFNALAAFQKMYGDSVATGEDMKNLLESKTGMEFDWFFDQWYYGEGHPEFRISWRAAHDTLRINSLQESSVPSREFFNVLVPFRVQFYDRKDTMITFRQDSNYEEFVAVLPGMIKNIIFDPENWLLARLESFTNIVDSLTFEKTFVISPNPVTDKLRIIFKNEYGSYRIYISDLNGHLLAVTEGDEEVAHLDLSHLAAGNYILVIEKNKILYTQKIVKK